jgi:hypothetical protein
VLIAEVDAVDAEPREAALACRPHVCRVPADLILAVAGEMPNLVASSTFSLTSPCKACQP